MANSLLKEADFDKNIALIMSLYSLAGNGRKRADMCEICPEFGLILKIAELAIQVKHWQSNQADKQLIQVPALDDLCAMNIPACFWLPIMQVLESALPKLLISSGTLHDLSIQLYTAQVYFNSQRNGQERFSEIVRTIGQLHLTASSKTSHQQQSAP